ncbi:MAG: hypothetical protein C6I01_00605 [Epsilonproteobacteria bacterium]|nr:hypothetical protein [Campylobacterota bacterium]NPA88916.1 hypothetical protein [Campylobacterota bacterium]
MAKDIQELVAEALRRVADNIGQTQAKTADTADTENTSNVRVFKIEEVDTTALESEQKAR